MNLKQMDDEFIIQKCISNDSSFRKALAKESLSWFFAIYFSHYITCPTANFQREMIRLFEDPALLKVAVTAFRGSGKSTLATLVYVIWAMIGKPNKKYILLISQTQELAKQILTNIKQELSTNELLTTDFGPFSEIADEWRSNSLVNPKYNTRISAISQSEGIRGLRHKQYRPDLVIVDDVENLESVKTKENRDKLWDWLTGEVLPIGDIGTKMIFVGNLLHEDSLMMRLKENILGKKMDGIYKEYPLVNDKKQTLWPGKYSTLKDIELKHREVADESAWYREYLLKIIADEDRIIHSDWIKHYDELPNLRENPPWIIATGVDLAISQKTTSDYTAFVSAYVTGYGKDLRIYILPFITNSRFTHPQTIEALKKLNIRTQTEFKRYPMIYVENVAYQAAVTQQLSVEGVFAEPVIISGLDKRTRLSITSPYIKTGKVLFPKHGVKDLISQIVNFGIEKHDDLADAFSIMVIKVIEKDRPSPNPSTNDSDPGPVYRNFGDGPVDMSKPFFTSDMQF